MRTFISIDIPDNTRKELRKIIDSLPEFLGKKTELENLHLTLKFLGEISEETYKEVKKRLELVKFNSFVGEIDSVGFFAPNYIRILWLHIKGAEELQKEIDSCLNGLFKPEKIFMSHLTIARVKGVKDKKKFIEEINKMKISPINFKVDSFKFRKSTLRPQGPLYETLEEYNSN